MEMIVVVPPGPDLAEPGALLARLGGLLAERLLDGRMHENARHLRVGGGALDELHMEQCERRRIDGERVLEHGHRTHVLPLLWGQDVVRHGGEPNVGIEPDLMAGMAGEHRSATRLRHVADEEPGPAVERARVACQPLEIIEEARVAPIAVAGEPHHLPVGAVDRQRRAAGETTFGVAADRAGGERSGRSRGAEQLSRGRPFGLGRRLLGGGLGRRFRGRGRRNGLWRARLLSCHLPAKHDEREAQNQPSHVLDPFR